VISLSQEAIDKNKETCFKNNLCVFCVLKTFWKPFFQCRLYVCMWMCVNYSCTVDENLAKKTGCYTTQKTVDLIGSSTVKIITLYLQRKTKVIPSAGK